MSNLWADPALRRSHGYFLLQLKSRRFINWDFASHREADKNAFAKKDGLAEWSLIFKPSRPCGSALLLKVNVKERKNKQSIEVCPADKHLTLQMQRFLWIVSQYVIESTSHALINWPRLTIEPTQPEDECTGLYWQNVTQSMLENKATNTDPLILKFWPIPLRR